MHHRLGDFNNRNSCVTVLEARSLIPGCRRVGSFGELRSEDLLQASVCGL